MHAPIRTFLALALVAMSARAGDAIIDATGTVAFVGVTSGPFAGVAVNAPAHLRFEVFTPGTGGSPGLENYDVDVSTIRMEIGAASASGTGGTPSIVMQNGNPGGTDGIRFFSAPITGGSTVVFDFGAMDGLFNSTDPLQNLGTWTPTMWSAYDWRIFGGGNNIEFTPVTISISSHSTGTPFCLGDGSGTACPCANASPVGDASGCLNSMGIGGKLTATGSASLSNDTLVLEGAQMPNSSALYFQGTSQQAAGAGAVFGDGLRCAGGSIVRLGTVTNVAGTSQYPEAGDASVSVRGTIGAAGTRTYQVWYRNAAAFCSPSTFNLTNGLEIAWGT